MLNPTEAIRLTCAILAIFAVLSFTIYFKFLFEFIWSIITLMSSGIFNTAADTIYVLCVIFNAFTACVLEILPEIIKSWRFLVLFSIILVIVWVNLYNQRRYGYNGYYQRENRRNIQECVQLKKKSQEKQHQIVDMKFIYDKIKEENQSINQENISLQNSLKQANEQKIIIENQLKQLTDKHKQLQIMAKNNIVCEPSISITQKQKYQQKIQQNMFQLNQLKLRASQQVQQSKIDKQIIKSLTQTLHKFIHQSQSQLQDHNKKSQNIPSQMHIEQIQKMKKDIIQKQETIQKLKKDRQICEMFYIEKVENMRKQMEKIKGESDRQNKLVKYLNQQNMTYRDTIKTKQSDIENLKSKYENKKSTTQSISEYYDRF